MGIYGENSMDLPRGFYQAFWSFEKKVNEYYMSLSGLDKARIPTISYLKMRLSDKNIELWEKSDYHLQIAALRIKESKLRFYFEVNNRIYDFLNNVDIDIREEIALSVYYDIRHQQLKYDVEKYWDNFALILVLLRDPELYQRIPGVALSVKKSLIVLCMQRMGIKNSNYHVIRRESVKGFLYRLMLRKDVGEILDSMMLVLDSFKATNFEIYEEFITTIEEVKSQLGISEV